MGVQTSIIPQIRKVYYSAVGDFPATGLVPYIDLAYGTDTQRLYVWDGAAWQPITPNPTAFAQITSGTYTGDDTANRAISHGLGVTPRVVFIFEPLGVGGYVRARITGGVAVIYSEYNAGTCALNITIPDLNNFYIGHAADYYKSCNSAFGGGVLYYWVAIA